MRMLTGWFSTTWVPAVVMVWGSPFDSSITPAMTERAALPVHRKSTWAVTGGAPVGSAIGTGRTLRCRRGGPSPRPTARARAYRMWMPETARAMIRRWISEVPSKMV